MLPWFLFVFTNAILFAYGTAVNNTVPTLSLSRLTPEKLPWDLHGIKEYQIDYTNVPSIRSGVYNRTDVNIPRWVQPRPGTLTSRFASGRPSTPRTKLMTSQPSNFELCYKDSSSNGWLKVTQFDYHVEWRIYVRCYKEQLMYAITMHSIDLPTATSHWVAKIPSISSIFPTITVSTHQKHLNQLADTDKSNEELHIIIKEQNATIIAQHTDLNAKQRLITEVEFENTRQLVQQRELQNMFQINTAARSQIESLYQQEQQKNKQLESSISDLRKQLLYHAYNIGFPDFLNQTITGNQNITTQDMSNQTDSIHDSNESIPSIPEDWTTLWTVILPIIGICDVILMVFTIFWCRMRKAAQRKLRLSQFQQSILEEKPEQKSNNTDFQVI